MLPLDVVEAFKSVAGENIVLHAFLGGTLCSLLTLAGASPILLTGRVPPWFNDASLGFASGVMLTASFTSLILPAITMSNVNVVSLSIVVGFVSLMVLDKTIPHEHFIKGFEGVPLLRERIKRIWLMVFAITIHNMPEGLAVGVTFTDSLLNGIKTSIAIGLQDMPEGLAVALPLATTVGYSRVKSLSVAALTGFVELITAVLGASIITLTSMATLPIIMGVSAGMMLYVISHELIPESHRSGHEDAASIGLIVGFILTLLLDSLFST